MATKAIRGSRATILMNHLNVSGYLNEHETEGEAEELTFTPFESDEAEVVSGSKTYTSTFTGAWNGEDESLDALLDAGFENDLPFTITKCPGGVSSGKAVYLMPGTLINNNDSAASDEIAEIEAEFKTKRARGKVLHHGLVSATGNGAPLVADAATNVGAAAHLHVYDVTGAPTSVAIVVESSPDGTTWSPLLTFDPVTEKGHQRKETLPTASVPVQLRAKHTITGGTTPTVNYTVAVARRV